MGKQIRRQSILKELAMYGVTVTFGRKEFKLSGSDNVSHIEIPCIFSTQLTVGLSVEGLLLKPPAIIPPKMICEPSESRAEEGYHL